MSSTNFIYSALNLIAPAIILPVFACFERGRARIWDRLGFWNCELAECIWLHAASLGEAVGLTPVANEIKLLNPETQLFGTSASATALVKMQNFCENVRLLPFDHKIYFENCIKAVNPKIFIFSEAEIWPNLLIQLEQKKIPTVLVNARISDRSFKFYKKFPSLFGRAFNSLKYVFVTDRQSLQRYLELGVSSDLIQLLPNTKYDQPLQEQLPDLQKSEIKKTFFKKDLPTIVFGSLRPSEEKIVFEAISRVGFDKFNFVVAPRHKEKFSFFEKALKSFNLTYTKKSELLEPTDNILFLDTHGELVSFMQIADLTFVGGTLADGYGGHNPLEAAQFGVPVAVGPFYSKIRDVVDQLEQQQALIKVKNSADLAAAFNLSATELTNIGLNAKKVCNFFAGSSKIVANKINSLMES